uniref:Uncharacterized mitochondrial protein AtMg00810-like n=1 Tax=Nicotiana tabacum TaxID=4097 RepID=A0A1S4CPA6_TOBAC|nr:PREDICTED: uncharacterized mitochondrial protein AtMg00810-like [Nicotiana tabacum]
MANVHGVPADLLNEKENDPILHDENQNVNLTKEQYGLIMSLLQHFQTGNTGGSPSNANITNGAVNFAASKDIFIYNVLKSVSFPTYIEGDIPHPGVQSSADITSPVVYVDDVFITGIDSVEIDNLKAFFDKQFRIKGLGRLYYFLGLEVLYKPDGVIISQRKFALDLLKEYDYFAYSILSSPLDPTLKLKANEGTLLPDLTYYRKLVGKLNFLTDTRLDIAYNVQLLIQFMQAPRDTHLTATFHLLIYLKKDPTLGIFYSNNSGYSIFAYCDSDWAACPDSRRSITGYIIPVGDSPISRKSKK